MTRMTVVSALLLALTWGSNGRAAEVPGAKSHKTAPKLTSRMFGEKEYEVCCTCDGPGACVTCPTARGTCRCGGDASASVQCGPTPAPKREKKANTRS